MVGKKDLLLPSDVFLLPAAVLHNTSDELDEVSKFVTDVLVMKDMKGGGDGRDGRKRRRCQHVRRTV